MRENIEPSFESGHPELTAGPVACDELLEAVGQENLSAITQDFLELVNSASSIYSNTGQPVIGIFASGWCRLLSQASRDLCGNISQEEAIKSGNWLCHESCWAASKRAIESGLETEAECHGGIRLYAAPIRAGKDIVGAINFGFGDPPTDMNSIRRIAGKYRIQSHELEQHLKSYPSRPEFIVEMAKKRLSTAAKLLGAIVNWKRREERIQKEHLILDQKLEYQTAELNSARARVKLITEKAPALMDSVNRNGYIMDVTDYWLEVMGYGRDEVVGRHITEFMTEESKTKALGEDLPVFLETGSLRNTEYQFRKKNGELLDVIFSAAAERDFRGKIVQSIAVLTDISDLKRTEETLRRKNALLEAIHDAQMQFISDAKPRVLFGNLLEKLLALTGSEFGSIGEVLPEPEEGSILRVHAMSDIGWNDKTRELYQKHISDQTIEFRTVSNLFGKVIESESPVLSNDPASDPRRGGIPKGHPEIKCFLGLPFHFEGKLVGAAALANRGAGYQIELVEYLQPFISACANIIQAYRTHREHRKAEESLRKSAERYEQIFTKNKSIKLLMDSEGVIVDANPSAAEFYGYSQEEMIGMHIGQINNSPPEKIADAIRKVHAEEKMSFVFQHKLRSGDVRDVEISSTPIEIGDRKLIYSIVTDITERKKAEAELKESEERFQTIFNAATDFIYTKDVYGRFMDVNPAIESFTGLKASQIRGKRTEDVFGEELARTGRESESRVLQGESVEKELTFSVKGSSLTLTCCMMPLKGADGNVTGILGIARDITDRRRRETLITIPETYVSEAMRLTLNQAEMAAKRNATILLLGESGTGKDYLARHIHNRSERAGGPYFAVNCAAIAPELAESELFGHEKGAFTGAIVRKRGLLELAEGGTLLLNEIGELSLPLQAKLLTFLDTRKFTRVGGEKEITVNARLIAATNRDLENEIRERRFRQDLFYRLSVLTIRVPPLRERKDDIPFLVKELLSNLVSELQLPHMPVIEPRIIHALKRYDWPGNVRELRNVLERSLILSHGQELKLGGFGFGEEPEESMKATFTASFPSEQSINEVTQELKRFYIAEALKRSGGNRQGAAKMLGISRYSLKHYMKSLGFRDGEND